ncbi:LysR family transcriptional regulator [Rhizobium sp. 11515TR]|uniref:LysR family transcriptional regulator n=1 Tax=Rhizobium sp. 11515TR TaxID=2028343 RepID=UPI000BA85E93|nr:LysR family transcriptional regulator [Rhizobium sp. 11515TR]ASW09873.1 LysR family transcriptional regulator [Rhizobium sp. 11515TR]
MTNLGDFEVFAKVVATGNMSLAGKLLGFSPAVVSKRIKRLEDRLETRLLQRTTRQMTLTEAGRGFYERVINILAGIEEAEAYISGRTTHLSGTLRLSAPTSFGRMHIAPHLKGFMDKHPSIVVELTLNDGFSDLIAEGYDLAIRIGELSDSSLIARRLASVRRILCASPDYIATNGAPRSIDDLQRHCCLPSQNGDPWKLVGPRGSFVVRPQAGLVTNSSEVVREAVIAGIGIALRSTWDIGEELRKGRLVRVLPEIEGSHNITVSAVYPTREFLPSKVRAFIDYLARVYGPHPYWDRNEIRPELSAALKTDALPG